MVTLDVDIRQYTLFLPSGDTLSAESFHPQKPLAAVTLAHGAGAGMNHSFMTALAHALAEQHIASLRFNFLYMEKKKFRPDSPAVAHQAVALALDKATALFPDIPIFLAGKSFGGRMNSQFAAAQQPGIQGLIFFGFPLHPAGSPSIDRADHLQKVSVPMLFLQGTRDALADLALIQNVTSALPSATLQKWEGADHGFKKGKENLIPQLASAVKEWMSSLL